MDFTYLAASSHMFVKITCRPQPRLTYGHCSAVSDGTVEPLIPIGAAIIFPSVTNYLVAKPEMVELLRESTALSLTVIRGEITSTYLLDLEGVRRPSRNKTDIPQREKDTYFVFRAMDTEKLDYSISTDLVLQPEAYRSMICEQGDTQTDDQHPAFTACGLISRVQSLALFSNKEKLKLMLIGSVLVEGSVEDFVTKEPISNRAAPCASHNSRGSQEDHGGGPCRFSSSFNRIGAQKILQSREISKGHGHRRDESS